MANGFFLGGAAEGAMNAQKMGLGPEWEVYAPNPNDPNNFYAKRDVADGYARLRVEAAHLRRWHRAATMSTAVGPTVRRDRGNST